MKKKLKDLLSSVAVTGITDDSRKVLKGNLFVAVKGLKSDGHDFIPQAIASGAKVIVGERDSSQLKIPEGIIYHQVTDSKEALGILASLYFDEPSEKLTVIGVTGTKGKTTTCHLIYHLLTGLGEKAGLISSITSPGFHVTTPDAITLHKLLKEMVKSGCHYAVIEVSSHGIDQKRIAGVKFDIGVLTNIAPEHLDYHKTFAEYKKVKLAFIKSAKIQIIGKKDTNIDILPGKFNNLNAQVAIDTVAALGFGKSKAIQLLHSFKLPEGRLGEVKNNLGFKIYIDFAHTPDSLREVLNYLRQKTEGKLIAVFGCAGERDPNKRIKMGEISGKLADLSVFTAEDPRSEDVFDILKQMEEKARNYVSISERGEAIVYALNKAKEGDCVVICGKGHEKSMAYGSFEHPWSDKETVENYLEGRKDLAAIVLAAGRGKRLNAEIPKVLYEVAGRPMVSYTLENLRRALVTDITLVSGFKADSVVKRMGGAARIAYQYELLGTADAVKRGLEKIPTKIKTVLVLNGDDSLFYRSETISKVIKRHQDEKAFLTFVSLEVENPEGLGRVIRNSDGDLVAIVEEKVANREQKKTREINDGLYIFNRAWLEANLGKIQKSPVGEYYLVDLVKIAIQEDKKIYVYRLSDAREWHGINTQEELQEAEEKMKKKLNKWN